MKIKAFILLIGIVLLLSSCSRLAGEKFIGSSSDVFEFYLEDEQVSDGSSSSPLIPQSSSITQNSNPVSQNADASQGSASQNGASQGGASQGGASQGESSSEHSSAPSSKPTPSLPDSSSVPIQNKLVAYDGTAAAKSSNIAAAVSHYFSNGFSVHRYYYSKLNPSIQKLYNEIDAQVKKGNQSAVFTFNGSEKEITAFYQNSIWPAYYNYVLDNTWAFFLPSNISVEILGSKITLKFSYLYTQEQILNTFAKINGFIKQAKSNLSSSMSDYEKELSLYNFVCHSLVYSESNPTDAHNLTGAVNGKGVCEAYSEILKLLFDSVGLKSLIVSGQSKETKENHAWNMVCIDGKYTYVDATYGDTSSSNDGKTKYISNTDGTSDAVVNYSYFNMSDTELFKKSELKKKENYVTLPALPACTQKLDFYSHYGYVVNTRSQAQKYLQKVASQIKATGKRYFYIKSDTLSHKDIVDILGKYINIKTYFYIGGDIHEGSLSEIVLH